MDERMAMNSLVTPQRESFVYRLLGIMHFSFGSSTSHWNTTEFPSFAARLIRRSINVASPPGLFLYPPLIAALWQADTHATARLLLSRVGEGCRLRDTGERLRFLFLIKLDKLFRPPPAIVDQRVCWYSYRGYFLYPIYYLQMHPTKSNKTLAYPRFDLWLSLLSASLWMNLMQLSALLMNSEWEGESDP